MGYRRSWNMYSAGSYKTKVSIHWSKNAGAYQIQFHGSRTYNGRWYYPTKERWTQIKEILIAYIMKIPYGERDNRCVITTPDMSTPEIKLETWYYYLAEQHIDNFKSLVELMQNDFELDFVERQPEETTRSKFVPVEVYLTKFKEITNEDITTIPYRDAKRIYLRNSLILHPDRNPENPEAGRKMSELNEIWTNLEYQHFKTKQEVLQVTGE